MSKLNLFLLALMCWAILLLLYIFERDIVSNTYGFLLIIVLSTITGVSVGLGLAKD